MTSRTDERPCKHENLMRHDYHGETWWQCEDGCDFVFRLTAKPQADYQMLFINAAKLNHEHGGHTQPWDECGWSTCIEARAALKAHAEAAPTPISFGVPTLEVSNEASPGVVMSPPVTFSPSGNRTFVDGKEVFLKDTVRMGVTRSQPQDAREAAFEEGIKFATEALLRAAHERGIENAVNFYGEYVNEARAALKGTK